MCYLWRRACEVRRNVRHCSPNSRLWGTWRAGSHVASRLVHESTYQYPVLRRQMPQCPKAEWHWHPIRYALHHRPLSLRVRRRAVDPPPPGSAVESAPSRQSSTFWKQSRLIAMTWSLEKETNQGSGHIFIPSPLQQLQLICIYVITFPCLKTDKEQSLEENILMCIRLCYSVSSNDACFWLLTCYFEAIIFQKC